MVRERKFRADLYYRLNVFPMMLPPLRERPEDIALLAEHFVDKFARQQGKEVETIPDDVMDVLELYDWPGNIRELQNVIERGVIITTDSVLSRQTIEHLAASVRVSAAGERGGIERIADVERGAITAALRATNWVVGGPKGAAVQLGLPRTTLLSRMQRLGIPSGVVQRRRRSIGKLAQVAGGMSSHLRDGSSDRLPVMEAVAV